MDFNEEQLKAINSPLDKHVLVSASAGSGKTQILSQKVYKVLTETDLKPENIIVLTFTNKAAYEMKERIIKTIKENDPNNLDLINQIVSAKIQTFDSLAMDLVKNYASILRVPSNIEIISSEEVQLMVQKYIDEIFDEYINDNNQELFNLIKSLDSFKYNKTKEVIYCIYQKINKLGLEDQKFLFDEIDYFYKKDVIEYKFDTYVLNYTFKNLLYPLALFCYLNSTDYLPAVDMNNKIDNFLSLFKNWNKQNLLFTYCRKFTFADPTKFDKRITAFINRYLMIIENILTKNYSALPDPNSIAEELMYKKKTKDIPNFTDVFKSNHYNNYNNLYKLIDNKKAHFDSIDLLKDKTKIIIELIKKVQDKVNSYKQKTNKYEYSDVFHLALKLFEIEEVKNQLQEQYKFIVVDEYQDTNDEQEKFINYFSEKGKLFMVGDVKQSIYLFRNSNVELFNDRRNIFYNENNGVVIDMNYNYRSFEKVIDDINVIFKNYMKVFKGGVDYDSNEHMLQYDHKTNRYNTNNLPYDEDNYGIKILPLNKSAQIDDEVSNVECKIIIQDIINKVSSHYKIYDPKRDENGNIIKYYRDCKYSDFAILVRKKRNFANYLSLFNEYNVPLVNKIEVDLKDTDVYLCVKSLLSLLACRLGLLKENELHYFVSIARSYLYGNNTYFTDENIYKIVQEYKKDKNAKLYVESEIIKKIDAIVDEYSKYPISYIFIRLINDFGVISKLNLVGELNDNSDKIFSLFNNLVSNDNLGLSLLDFISKIDDYNKYSLSITYSYESSNPNAVQLMSLHGSKGLEFPIIYLPSSENKVSVYNKFDETKNYVVSTEDGIIIPDYYPEQDKITESFLFDYNSQQNTSDDEIYSENARLYYVLLTRAKESIYIVGNEKSLGYRDESLYSLLNFSKHSYEVESNFLLDIVEDKLLPLNFEDSCDALAEMEENINIYKSRCSAYFYNYFIDFLYNKVISEKNINEKSIYNELKKYFVNLLKNNDDLIIKLITNDKEFEFFSYYLPNLKKTFSSVKDGLDNIKITNSIAVLKKFVSHLIEFCLDEYHPICEPIYKYFDKIVLKDELKSNDDYSKELFDSKNINDTEIRCGDGKPSDDIIYFKKLVKHRASKELKVENEEDITPLLELGTTIHKILEIVDFKTKDLSFLNNLDDKYKKYKTNITNFLNSDLLKDISDAQIYKEYEFYDPNNLSKGSIDCLLIKKNKAVIIDYKLKKIDDDSYKVQLNTYKDNVKRLFKISNVECYLYSILDNKYLKIES